MPLILAYPSSLFLTVNCSYMQPLFSQIKSDMPMGDIKFWFTSDLDLFTCGKFITLWVNCINGRHVRTSNQGTVPSAILSYNRWCRSGPKLKALHAQCNIHCKVYTYSEILSAVILPHSNWTGQVSLRYSTVRRVTEQRVIVIISKLQNMYIFFSFE